MLQDVNCKIAAEKRKAEDEARAQMAERRQRMEQEARSRAQQEMREKRAKFEKEQAEFSAKQARNAQLAREAQECQRKAEAAERRLREAEARAAEERAAEEAARRANNTRNNQSRPVPNVHNFPTASRSTNGTCKHSKFRPRVEGRQTCSNCHAFQRRFAFQCPDCSMIACANCRQNLRGERKRNYNSDRQSRFPSSYEAEISFYDDFD